MRWMDVMNYGSMNSIFAVSEKSQSFRKQIVEYILVFRTEHGIKNFKVNKQIYDSNEEGTVGNLYYNKRGVHKFERLYSK